MANEIAKLLITIYVMAINEERNAVNTSEYEEKKKATDESYLNTIFYIDYFERLLVETWAVLVGVDKAYTLLKNTNPVSPFYEMAERELHDMLERIQPALEYITPMVESIELDDDEEEDEEEEEED